MKERLISRHPWTVASTWLASRAAESNPALDVTQLYDEYADFVWRSLQRLGVPANSLEDALQDVFLVVHRRLDSYDGTSKLSSWLFGISLRIAAAHRRRAHLRHEKGSEPIGNHADLRPLANPEHCALRAEALRTLELALETMAIERRAVFVMFEIEGMPAGAIAEMLSIPVGTVHSRLHKARAEFTLALANSQGNEEAGGLR